MTASHFRLPEDFYRKLHSHLLTELQKENAARAQSPTTGFLTQVGFLGHRAQPLPISEVLPSLEHLTELIEVSFWASLDRVEGHQLSFSVGYENRRFAAYDTFSFSPHLPFTRERLRNLAPAIGSPESCAIVFPDLDDHLSIQGLGRSHLSPLIIKVLDPGRLIVRFNLFNRAVISGSEAVFIRNTFLAHSESIWSLYKFQDAKSDASSERINATLNIVRKMRKMGHGGILVVVPDDNNWKKYCSNIPYSTNEKYSPAEFALDFTQNASEGAEDATQLADSRPYWLAASLEEIAQLTTVDGAVIMTPNLEVLGFGVKLGSDGNNYEGINIASIDPRDDLESTRFIKLTETGNTRHQSAVRFVASYEQAVAFVVSQDGGVSAFVWEKDTKYFPDGQLMRYTQLELGLF